MFDSESIGGKVLLLPENCQWCRRGNYTTAHNLQKCEIECMSVLFCIKKWHVQHCAAISATAEPCFNSVLPVASSERHFYYDLRVICMQELVRSPAPQLHLEYTFYKLLAPAGNLYSAYQASCLYDGRRAFDSVYLFLHYAGDVLINENENLC